MCINKRSFFFISQVKKKKNNKKPLKQKVSDLATFRYQRGFPICPSLSRNFLFICFSFLIIFFFLFFSLFHASYITLHHCKYAIYIQHFLSMCQKQSLGAYSLHWTSTNSPRLYSLCIYISKIYLFFYLLLLQP